LFDQLGLPSSDDDIAGFVERHQPVGDAVYLHQMSFFNKSQQAFLREAVENDADWAEVIDTLDSLIRREADIRPS
jgi:hypothetical protein